MNWTTYHVFGEASVHVWIETYREVPMVGSPNLVIYWDLAENPGLFIQAAAQGGP